MVRLSVCNARWGTSVIALPKSNVLCVQWVPSRALQPCARHVLPVLPVGTQIWRARVLARTAPSVHFKTVNELMTAFTVPKVTIPTCKAPGLALGVLLVDIKMPRGNLTACCVPMASTLPRVALSSVPSVSVASTPMLQLRSSHVQTVLLANT